MPKAKRQYVCSACGSVQPRWMGKCPACNSWDTLEEVTLDASASKDPHKGLAESVGAVWTDSSGITGAPTATAVPISQAVSDAPPDTRIITGVGEFDRVLGGGFVPGSVVLLGGDPGIGKSTLLLQSAGALAGEGDGEPESTSGNSAVRTLYVTSEESADQVRQRGVRLGVSEHDELFVLAETNLARIVEQARQVQPEVLAIDSIQMIYKADMDASPGSVSQIRRCCTELVYLAKATGMAVVLVGHVTKDGQLAGPRLLEHLVDAVLYFEGDRYHAHRVVRAVKNRFGNTLEIGLFEMAGDGLREVPEGASVAAAAWTGSTGPRPGSAVCPVQTGSRCVLVELQALTATGFPGSVKRKSSGIDSSRLSMLIAVLEQHAGMRLYDMDVFASAVGGVRVTEPAADLALAIAIAGAHTKRSLPEATAALGEVGLGGEVRPVTQMEARVREAARLGYKRILVPPGSEKGLKDLGISLIPCRTLDEAIAEITQ